MTELAFGLAVAADGFKDLRLTRCVHRLTYHPLARQADLQWMRNQRSQPSPALALSRLI